MPSTLGLQSRRKVEGSQNLLLAVGTVRPSIVLPLTWSSVGKQASMEHVNIKHFLGLQLYCNVFDFVRSPGSLVFTGPTAGGTLYSCEMR